jgi:hypothetical protein
VKLVRVSWLPVLLVITTLLLPAGAGANGVPQLVKLTYVPGISNFGPQDAEGVLEFSFAERYARADVKNLVPQEGYTYEGWMLTPAGDALSVGAFSIDAAGIGSMEGSFEGIERYDYNVFVVAARPADAPLGILPDTISIAGNFTIIEDPSGPLPGDSRPLQLPETGQRPADGGISPLQASLWAMTGTGLLLVLLSTIRKRRARR